MLKHRHQSVFQNYRRIGKKLVKELQKQTPHYKKLNVLDWGGNDGVLSQVLLENGFENITLYDVGPERKFDFDRFPLLKTIQTKFGDDVVKIPFEDAQFDVVISTGVLEHVPFMNQSIQEIHRILKPDGHFMIFHFPHRFSWTEWIASIHQKSGHIRKLTARELSLALINHGFDPRKQWKFNFLPKTLYGLPDWALSIYSPFTPLIYGVDHVLSKIPLLNLLCNSIECHAIKRMALR